MGSGVGGALIVNRALVRGFQGAAGEIGHSVMITGGHPCNCGRRGCMENYVSGRSMKRRAAPIIGDRDLFALARAGDDRALAPLIGALLFATAYTFWRRQIRYYSSSGT